ncbi:MAG: exonuclease domain-containing protein [Saccharofermentans sp.]|nr:exonuclease domain-containing protein [Saccharofermentans sp.]
MLSRKITDGTEFVVFDMEWNQAFPGKKYDFEVSELTGEIIEVGAVKYIYDNGSLVRKGTFSEDVRPVKYRKLHYHVKKVTQKTNKDLEQGRPFKDVYEDFKRFAGVDAILVGWGNSDPAMLKMNLKFFGMDPKLGMEFLDLQPIFSLFSGQSGQQKSVESAVDFYNIPKNDIFHSATADAHYTGEIFEQIFSHNKPSEVISAISSSSVNPDIKSEFGFIGRDCPDAESAFAEVSSFVSKCPICGRSLTARIAPFRIRKSKYALYFCSEHGEMFSRTRLKKRKDGKAYATSVLRFATQNDYYLVASKKEEFDKFGEKGAPVEVKETEDSQTDS